MEQVEAHRALCLVPNMCVLHRGNDLLLTSLPLPRMIDAYQCLLVPRCLLSSCRTITQAPDTEPGTS